MTPSTVKCAHAGSVEYVIVNGDIYFCGISDIRNVPAISSVVNSVARILEAITAAEPGKTISRFFAILTHVNWVCKRGTYDLRQIVAYRTVTFRKTKTIEFEWKLVKAFPEEVRQAFSERIGDEHPRPIKREEYMTSLERL